MSIRRAWSNKHNDLSRRLENASLHTRRKISEPAWEAFHRRAIRSLELECKPLRRHSSDMRNSLSTFLELMLDLDAGVSRHELLCHVLSYGWDYMACASSQGSLFVQPVSNK